MIEIVHQILPELQNASSSTLGSHFAFNQTYLAYLVDSNYFIECVNIRNKATKKIDLEISQNGIKCLKLSDKNLLCACGSDSIATWDLNTFVNSQTCNAKIIGKNAFNFEPRYCCFHSNGKLLAVCNGNNISFFDAESGLCLNQAIFIDYPNFVEFFSCDEKNFLVISTHSNSILIYDLLKKETIQTIKNKSSLTSFVHLSCLNNRPHLLTNTSDNSIHVFEFSNKTNEFMFRKSTNLEKSSHRLKQSQAESVSSSFLCLGLKLFAVENGSFNATASKNLIACIATSNFIFLIDLNTSNIIYELDLDRTISNKNEPFSPQNVDFIYLMNKNQIYVALHSLFRNEISILKLDGLFLSDEQTDEHEKETLSASKDEILSVIPSESVLKTSPLNEEFAEKEILKQTNCINGMQDYFRASNSSIRKTSSLDKPVVFNSRIKSSGYSSTAKNAKMFTPSTRTKKPSLSLSNLRLDSSKSSISSSKSKKSSAAAAELKFSLPTYLKKKVDATFRSSPILMTSFSDDGQNLALASNDYVVQYLKLTQLDKPYLAYNNHTDKLNSIDISHDCNLILSSSSDRTCKLWSTKNNKLLFDIQSLKKNDKIHIEFKKEIVAANFFYLDKFILIGCEKSFYLTKYHIDRNRNDLQRYVNNSACKLVQKFDLTFAQNISTLTAINSFYSYLVFCGGTDKSLEVFDLNQAKSSLTIHETHSRPFHQICLNKSEFNQASYDLFLTNSLGDGLKLWDLRTAKCVCKFESHISRSIPSKASFSPDSNYISIGSEDRSCFIYDIRANDAVEKLSGFSETVTSAQFSPKMSLLLCATQDGKLFSYETK